MYQIFVQIKINRGNSKKKLCKFLHGTVTNKSLFNLSLPCIVQVASIFPIHLKQFFITFVVNIWLLQFELSDTVIQAIMKPDDEAQTLVKFQRCNYMAVLLTLAAQKWHLTEALSRAMGGEQWTQKGHKFCMKI